MVYPKATAADLVLLQYDSNTGVKSSGHSHRHAWSSAHGKEPADLSAAASQPACEAAEVLAGFMASASASAEGDAAVDGRASNSNSNSGNRFAMNHRSSSCCGSCRLQQGMSVITVSCPFGAWDPSIFSGLQMHGMVASVSCKYARTDRPPLLRDVPPTVQGC